MLRTPTFFPRVTQTHPPELANLQIPGPWPRPAESASLGVELRNLHFSKHQVILRALKFESPPRNSYGWLMCHLRGAGKRGEDVDRSKPACNISLCNRYKTWPGSRSRGSPGTQPHPLRPQKQQERPPGAPRLGRDRQTIPYNRTCASAPACLSPQLLKPRCLS